jgi:mRNA-degrading endonuclease toxin of MazEF toxin-antitoxin module
MSDGLSSGLPLQVYTVHALAPARRGDDQIVDVDGYAGISLRWHRLPPPPLGKIVLSLHKSFRSFAVARRTEIKRSPSSRSVQTTTNTSPPAFMPTVIRRDAPAEESSSNVSPSGCSDAPDFRVTIDPTEKNGLRVRSQVMADKPVTVRRERIGRQAGHLDDKDILRLNVASALVMSLAD